VIRRGEGSYIYWKTQWNKEKRKEKKEEEALTNIYKRRSMKMKGASATIGGSKRKFSCKGLGGFLKEGRGRLYILRRCIIMLLCWHD
jgi:hypothetical protein